MFRLPSCQAHGDANVSGLGLIIERSPQVQHAANSPCASPKVEHGTSLIPIVTINGALDRVSQLKNASRRNSEGSKSLPNSPKDIGSISPSQGASRRVNRTPKLDKHSTGSGETGPSPQLNEVIKTPRLRTSDRPRQRQWLFDNDTSSPLVLSDRLPTLPFSASRRAAALNVVGDTLGCQDVTPPHLGPFKVPDVVTKPSISKTSADTNPHYRPNPRMQHPSPILVDALERFVEGCLDLKLMRFNRRYAILGLSCLWFFALIVIGQMMGRGVMVSGRIPGVAIGVYPPNTYTVHAYATTTLKENLRPDLKYLIGQNRDERTTAGFVAAYKTMYLAKVMRRVPILLGISPPRVFLDQSAALLSSVFDFEHFAEATEHTFPLLELPAIKSVLDDKSLAKAATLADREESLQCWSSTSEMELHPPTTPVEDPLKPYGIKSKYVLTQSGNANRQCTPHYEDFTELTSSKPSLSIHSPETLHDASIHGQMLCVTGASNLSHRHGELHSSTLHSPTLLVGEDSAWFAIGQHLKFKPTFTDVADRTLIQLLGHKTSNRFVAVMAEDGIPLHRYADTLNRTYRKLGVSRRRFPVMLFYNQDPSLLIRREIRDRGWLLADVAISDVTLPAWLEKKVLMQVMMTRGSAFVGTKHDLTSTVTALRVKSWHNRPTDMA